MGRLAYESHGGGCCGMFHMYGFGAYARSGITLRDLESEIDDCYENQVEPHYDDDDEEIEGSNRDRVIEIVLIDEQFSYIDKNVLREAGFRFVNRFENSNSHGNMCNVFHYHPKGDVGIDWDRLPEARVPQPVVARPVVIDPLPDIIAAGLHNLVRSGYINVYRNGDGRHGEYETELEANAAASPNRIRLDVVSHWADGSSTRSPRLNIQ